MDNREKLSSRLGFILLSAGCAIGIGNVWKFPYVAGANGGAIFILIYLFFLIILGMPVLVMEFAMGRASKRSIARVYQTLTPSKKIWSIHGWMGLIGCLILMAFYTTVGGWMLRYFFESAAGTFQSMDPQAISAHFELMLSQPGALVFFMGIQVAAGFGICAAGLQNGLERITKYMMGALLICMIVLALNSVFMEGASEGLRYFLLPNWQAFLNAGPLNVIAAAMNQAFFTLSVGVGAMMIFGSYIDKDHRLASESLRVVGLDTFVAITAGLIIIPACFVYHVEVTSGPSLIFITLPNIFANMPYGQIWSALFFLFMTFAAFSTILTVFENIIACTKDLFGWSRKKACLIGFFAVFVLSLPCALGFNVLSKIEPLGSGSTIMDLEDMIVSSILLPLGSLIMVLYCCYDFGWGWKSFLKEVNEGKGIPVPDWLHSYCKYVLPCIIILVMILGFIKIG